jgi:S-adenosyl-L-methionine hydrolase (adenosine-forming)
MSPSFHGRDWFAPVAAALSRGERPALTELTRDGLAGAEWPDELPAVVYVDAYGNLLCGLRAGLQPPDTCIVAAGSRLPRARTFCEVAPGCAFWYENALGLVEIAVNQGRADVVLGLRPGDPVLPVRAAQ